MVAIHNQTSAGSGVSKRNPNPDRETKAIVSKKKSRENRRLRAQERQKAYREVINTVGDMMSVENCGLRQRVKSGKKARGHLNPKGAIAIVRKDPNPSPHFLAWVEKRKPS